MKVDELIAQRKAELEAAKAVVATAEAENRELTDEETASVEQHTAKAEELRVQIEDENARIEKQNALKAKLAAEGAWDKQPQKPTRSAKPLPTIVGGEGAKEFADFGEYLHNVRLAATDPRINGDLTRRLQAAASGLNTVVDSEGGFLIAPQFATQIQQRMYESGQVLSRVTRIPVTGNTYKIPYVNETSRATGSRWGGVRAYWAEEAGTVSSSKPKYGQLSLTLKKLMCIGYITEEQAQDYSATGSMLMTAFADEMAFVAEDALINGTGAGQPQGLMNAACLVSVAKETNQTAKTIWGPNVVKMWARCWARSRQNAVWLTNQDCEPQLWGLTLEGRFGSGTSDVEGVPLYMPAGSMLNTGTYGSLSGRPVIPVEYCKTLGTKGDVLLADFSQYVVIDKGGVRAAESMHVRFLYDEQTFRTTYRLDGAPLWPSALTPANGDNTLSPFVALDTRE